MKSINQRGQVVIILLLVMVVSLAVGLSVVGRSITEISTSSKTEDSSRAFSAAEAGLEKAFQTPIGNPVPTVAFNNQSQANVSTSQLPLANTALEYPPFGKEGFAQFWFANYTAPLDAGFPPCSVPCYNQNSFEVYFGKPDDPDGSYYRSIPDEKPAIEVHVIRRNGTFYEDKKYFYDSYSGTGNSARNPSWRGCNPLNPPAITTNDSTSAQSSFYCKVTVPPDPDGFTVDATHYLVMARVRVLYTNLAHPVAVKPVSGSLPPQAGIYRSTGTAGKSQRRLQVFQQSSVLPHYFDYVLFSAGSLSKATR
ncbi:MAG: hypothetical protein Q7S44_01550 [bacterium]|nr:hypothetical protein [bacterium]